MGDVGVYYVLYLSAEMICLLIGEISDKVKWCIDYINNNEVIYWMQIQMIAIKASHY